MKKYGRLPGLISMALPRQPVGPQGGAWPKVHRYVSNQISWNTNSYWLEGKDAVFAGDTFYPHTHYYVGEGHLAGALGHLAFLKDTFSDTSYIYSGHADPARGTSIDEQVTYIEKLKQETVRARQDPR